MPPGFAGSLKSQICKKKFRRHETQRIGNQPNLTPVKISFPKALEPKATNNKQTKTFPSYLNNFVSSCRSYPVLLFWMPINSKCRSIVSNLLDKRRAGLTVIPYLNPTGWKKCITSQSQPRPQGLLTFQHSVRRKISHMIRLSTSVFTPAAVIIISELWHQQRRR